MSQPNPSSKQQAPLYSKQERIRLIARYLVLTLLGWALNHYWSSPNLSQFSDTAHCYDYLGINGIAWLMYGVFVGVPLLIFIIFAGFGWPSGLRILRDGQYPAKGKKVLRPTVITYGIKAKLMGWLLILAPVMVLAIAIWGATQTETMLSQPIKSSAYTVCQTLK